MFSPPTPPLASPVSINSDEQAHANAQALAALARQVGIRVPPLLHTLVVRGTTAYGPDWPQQWRALSLSQPPSFISCADFEWMSAEERATAASEWLHPDVQGGRRFLPFAQNGAGDVYALTADGVAAPEGTESAVAWVPHDDDDGLVLHGSFDDLASALLLDAMADLSHQLGHFTEEEAIGITRRDVDRVSDWMQPDTARWLQTLAALPPHHHSVQDGPRARPRTVLALIPPPQHAVALGCLQPPPAAAPLRFTVVPRWEVPTLAVKEPRARVVPPPVALPTWQDLATDPATRRQAIRAYQVAHGVDLRAAKAALDAWGAAHD